MRQLVIATLAVFALGVLPTEAAAQDAQSNPGYHKGFWIGLGLGGGSNLSDIAEGARGGFSAYLRLGGSLNQRFLIGGEVIGWGRDIQGATYSLSNVNATLLFYPQGAGLHLKGGLGFAGWASYSSSGSTTTTTTAGGFGGTVGAGYDVRIGSNIFLTPNVDFLYQQVDDAVYAFNTASILLFTLGLTWH
jgi:hypothetical protein